MGRRMLEEAAIAELESIAGEKQAAMNAWLDEKRGNIKTLADDPAMVEETFVLKTASLDYRLASLTRNRLVREFQLRVSEGEFLSVMLLDSESGKVMVSTDPQEENSPKDAYEMLSSIQYLKPALAIPYFYHEKWDGSRYPLGLRGEQIPLEARIFSVIDVWDALLSDRPYRKAWTVERTLEYIQALAGSHFDPNVVDSFMKIMKP